MILKIIKIMIMIMIMIIIFKMITMMIRMKVNLRTRLVMSEQLCRTTFPTNNCLAMIHTSEGRRWRCSLVSP